MQEDVNQKVQIWREKATAGTLTQPEMREAIQFLRGSRKASVEKAKKKGTSKKIINSNDLLGELDKL